MSSGRFTVTLSAAPWPTPLLGRGVPSVAMTSWWPFACEGREFISACNGHRMVETAAHVVDHVFPRRPVRQWVLSLPKRLRYILP
jgi:hypothetical protein